MAGKKLLVADDSLTIQKVIRLALSNEGYEIQAISDGADAIQQISTFRPHVVLIDVSLPTRTAFEIKRELNTMSDHAATRFVLMSSAFEKIDEAQAEEVGFDAHLTKPFDPAHLRQILSEVLAAPTSNPISAPVSAPPPHSPNLAPPPPGPVPEIEIAPSLSTGINPLGIQFDPPPPPGVPNMPTVPTVPTVEDELWGKHEEAPPPPERAEPERYEPEKYEKDEIRELTESTIRMSGLADLPQTPNDEFEWKVNEPSLRPPGALADVGGSSFSFAPPPPPLSEFSAPPGAPPLSMPPPMPVSDPTHGAENAMPGFQGFEDAIQRQVQQTVQQTLEKVAREILPDLAERVIKAEISRLLNEKV